MQAIITLPSGMTTLPTRLSKISIDVYYDQNSSKFYKLTVLQPLTLFIGEDVVTRQNLVLTNYDPSYLIMQQLAQSSSMRLQNIRRYFTADMYEKLCDLNDGILKVNKNKIAQFLQERIDAVNDVIEQNQYNKVVKKFDTSNKIKQQGKKSLSQEVIEILRKDIPQVFLQQVIRSKYEQEKIIRHVVTDNFVEQLDREDLHDKNKIKKKPTPKPKQVQPLPKNQPTLFQFSGKKA